MDKHMRFARFITRLAEHQFSLFGFRFGLDPILGLIGGFGDMVTVVIGIYFIWIAKQIGVSKKDIAQMRTNIALDFGIGLIPVIGDLFDFSFKAHTRNWKILHKVYADSRLP